MLYVMIRPQHAEQFSRGLCRLLRPSHLRKAEDVTDLYCEVIQYPSGEWSALVLPETETVPIHLEADGSEMAELLAVFVRDQALTEQEAAGIGQAVIGMRGREVRIADFIPPSWSQAVLTEEQAREMGWFPEERTQP